MPFTGDSFAHLFDWEKDPQRQEKIVNARLEAEFDGVDTGLSALAARVTATETSIASVGDYLESRIVVGSAVSLTTNVAADMASLSLTAGTWDISAIAVFLPAATTVVGNIIIDAGERGCPRHPRLNHNILRSRACRFHDKHPERLWGAQGNQVPSVTQQLNRDYMAAPTFEQLRPRYTNFWRDMQVTGVSALDQAATARCRSKARYEKVGKQLGIPWWFIAILHHRESSGNFAGVLHNGEHIIGTGKKTRLVPAGRGPFTSWEEAAVDALKMKGLHNIRDWTVERVCYEAERFNGFGYFFRGVPSAYLWSFSNIYLGGKYVADGVWSATARDQQIGVMPLLKRMMAQDSTIKFGRFTPGSGSPEIITTVIVVGTGGGIAATEANKPDSGWGNVIGIGVFTIIVAILAVVLVRKFRSRYQVPPVTPEGPTTGPEQPNPGA